MSANAPLGRPSKNTGRVEADWTSATQIGEVVSEVISQAAATSFIYMQILAASQVNHNIRNTGELSGAQADKGACCRRGWVLARGYCPQTFMRRPRRQFLTRL